MEVLDQDATFVGVVNGFHGLLEADGDENAEDDGGEMDEELAACGGGVMRWVDVDHAGSV
jgi:hypothetical protein